MSADNKLSTERRNLVDDYLDTLLDRKEQLTSKMAKFEAIINGIEFRLSHIPDQTRDDIVKACDKAAYTYAAMASVKGKLARVDTEITLYEET